VSCIPIVGATSHAQVQQNLKCIDVILSPEYMQRLNDISAFELGFPAAFFEEDAVKKNVSGGFYDQTERRSFLK